MNAEIISVGTELLLGQVVNLDTAIVAQELSGCIPKEERLLL